MKKQKENKNTETVQQGLCGHVAWKSLSKVAPKLPLKTSKFARLLAAQAIHFLKCRREFFSFRFTHYLRKNSGKVRDDRKDASIALLTIKILIMTINENRT